jgi:hypothetical protein
LQESSFQFPERTEEKHVRIAKVPTKIQGQHLQNTRLEHYHYTNQLNKMNQKNHFAFEATAQY